MSASRPSVLVVEGDPLRLDVMFELVENLGYRAFTVSDGAEALQLAEERAFAAVLADWELPSSGGPELARRLRAREGAGSHTPVIAVSADARSDGRWRCLSAGADDHLLRPFSREALSLCLRRWVPESGPGLLDEATVATIRRLGLIDQLFPAFIAVLPVQVRTLRAAVASGDRAAIRRHAHRLRGSSAQMGAAALAQVLHDIEGAATGAEDGVLSSLDAALDDLVLATTTAMMRELEPR